MSLVKTYKLNEKVWTLLHLTSKHKLVFGWIEQRIVLCRLIYPGLCINIEMFFNHYHGKILSVEHKCFEREVKEAIHIRALKPSLNRDGGRYNLPPIRNNIMKERLTESVTGTNNGGGVQPEEFCLRSWSSLTPSRDRMTSH